MHLRLQEEITEGLALTVRLVEPQVALIRVEQMEEPDQTKAGAVAVARRAIQVMAARLVDPAQQLVKQVLAAVAAVECQALHITQDASVVTVVALVVAVLAYLVKALAVPPLIKDLLALPNPEGRGVLAVLMEAMEAKTVNQVWAALTVVVVVVVVALVAATEPFVLSGPDARAHFPQPV
jgi:hypothetical protein